MKDLIVITGASCVSGTMELYLEQLRAAEIEVHVEDLSQVVLNGAGGNLAFKIHWLRKLTRQFAEYERLIFSDAFDVTFYGNREDVIKKIPKEGVLWAAEKNCYPDPSLAERIPGRHPWRFANGGLLTGTPQSLLEWCDAAERHPLYRGEMLDQEFLNKLLAEGDPLCKIDAETKLFFNLFGGYDELDFASGMPINTACCTWPNFLHASGHWDTTAMFARYERSLLASRSLANS